MYTVYFDQVHSPIPSLQFVPQSHHYSPQFNVPSPGQFTAAASSWVCDHLPDHGQPLGCTTEENPTLS